MIFTASLRTFLSETGVLVLFFSLQMCHSVESKLSKLICPVTGKINIILAS